MAKKTRRKRLSDKTAVLKSNKIQKTNKFEFNFNKEKYQVLGRRKQKGETGRPLVSRGKAIEERKKTLGNDLRNFGKTNKFVDRRLGERDTTASKEDKMIKRFALERRKRYGGKNVYQLDDVEENLTHYGQSLSEIEKYQDKPMSDDEEPNLSAEANFGGDSFENGEDKSRKNFIDDMITKSKQMKYEKQAQREQVQDMTDKLDEQWKNILNEKLMHQLLMQSSDREVPAEKTDYDVLVRELLFEKQQVKATDRLKSEEEIAKEERDQLEKMEQQRLRRMALGDDGDGDGQYRNPDDEETNLVFDRRGNRFDRKPISYIDGKIAEQNENDDDEVSNDSDAELNEDSDDQLELRLEDDGEEIEVYRKPAEVVSKITSADDARKQLPFVYEMPKSYSQLRSLLIDRDADEQTIVLNRLIKCLHPSLKEGNKQKLQKLFLFLLRYFDDVCESAPDDFPVVNLLDKLTVSLFKLASYGAEYAAKSVKALLNKHRNDFSTKFKRKQFPNLNVFAFLRLITNLFPSSDSWHPVVTPSLLFASEILTKCKIKTITDVGKGLLLCSIIVEYVSESKRYVPELVAFLTSVFFLAVDVEKSERPFLSTFGFRKQSKILVTKPDEDGNGTKMNSIEPLSMTSLFSKNSGKEISDISSCLFCATKLCRVLLSLWLDCSSLIEIFEPIQKFMDRISSASDMLRKEFEEFRSDFKTKRNSLRRNYLKFPPKPEKDFILFEPRIETNFNPERKVRKAIKGKSLEQQRMQHKYKREYKSTVRELKRDNEFLARQKFEENVRLDRERSEKTKRLMSSLMGQEADFKKLKRMKTD